MPKNFLALLAVAACASSAFALSPGDGVVVDFKDGSRMSGVLVKQGHKHLRLDFGGAEMSFPMTTVKSVKPKKNPVKTFQDMLKAAGDDRDKLLAAAEYARAHGLSTPYARLVARLGVPNQMDLDDAEENAALDQQSQDAIAAQEDAEAQINEEKHLERADARARREAANAGRHDDADHH